MFFVFIFVFKFEDTVDCVVFKDKENYLLTSFCLNHNEFDSKDETPEAFWLFAPGTSSSAASSACKRTEFLHYFISTDPPNVWSVYIR